LKSHLSRPYNPDIANAFFRSGYVESWGRGISKMTELCVAEGLPEPTYLVEGSDFWVTFKKDIYDAEYLEALGLNNRQVKAVLFAKEKGRITNSDYQSLNDVSRETATRDIKELTDKKLFKSSGQKGAGAFYTLN
jgi:ATP-dependent DNA helicase RecG